MIEAGNVHEVLRRHQLCEGFPLVADLAGSRGVWLRDAISGEDYLDVYTSFASWPIGYNHPRMVEPEIKARLAAAASTNVANPEVYTQELAGFVHAFATRVTPPGFPHHFWISGGALAVENALKAAFDWKARKLGRTSYTDDVNDLVIMHFERAFHGRSGYTMSLTNTRPEKVGLFPKFAWPRIPSPAVEFDPDGNIAGDPQVAEDAACAAIEREFGAHKGKVAAIIIEPMQAEGGDRHLRPEFLQRLRDYADAEEAMLIFDEVQTGFFGTGKAWMWQGLGVAPDIVAFGKKAQVCGIYASERVDEAPGNVFVTPSRISSTWGGSLVDMVRSARLIEIIEEEGLSARVESLGERVLSGLRHMARSGAEIRNIRGVGSLLAFTTPGARQRDAILEALFARRVIALPCGPDSVRFRLPFVMSDAEADELLSRTEQALNA